MIDSAKNFARCTVLQGYNNLAFEIELESGEGAKLPDTTTGQPFSLVWWNSEYDSPLDDPDKEIVRCTARSGDSLTLENDGLKRTAQEGTTAVAHNEIGKTYYLSLVLTAGMISDIQAELDLKQNLITVSDTPPGSPVVGQLWYDTN